jgi:hypothetical protein
MDEIDTASNESANGVPAAGAERSESPEAATPAKKGDAPVYLIRVFRRVR